MVKIPVVSRPRSIVLLEYEHFPIYLFLGHEKIVRMLIEGGANVNALNRDNNGNVPNIFIVESYCELMEPST